MKQEVKKILALALANSSKVKNDLGEITLLFTTSSNIKNLNRKFLKKNQATDVLTFSYNNEEKISGDIAICLEEIYSNAFHYEKGIVFLFYETILHGFLHLLGLKHDYSKKSLEQIYQLQGKILKGVTLNNDLVYECYKKINNR